MLLNICMKTKPPKKMAWRTHWPPGGPPRKTRTFRCTDFLEVVYCKRGGNGVGIVSADYLPRMRIFPSRGPPPLACAVRLGVLAPALLYQSIQQNIVLLLY